MSCAEVFNQLHLSALKSIWFLPFSKGNFRSWMRWSSWCGSWNIFVSFVNFLFFCFFCIFLSLNLHFLFSFTFLYILLKRVLNLKKPWKMQRFFPLHLSGFFKNLTLFFFVILFNWNHFEMRPMAQRIEALSLYGSRWALSEVSGFKSYPSRPEVYWVKNVVR